MKRTFYILIMSAIPVLLFAQKNVVTVSQTQMLGLSLPKDSKQDKRLISVAAAGSFLSMSTEYKNSEIKPVEVYSIPAGAGLTLEKIKSHLTSNGFDVRTDNGDSKLLWFTRSNDNWLVYLSQEARETNLYIGKGMISQLIPGNISQPVTVTGNNPQQSDNDDSSAKYPAYIPPLAGRKTVTSDNPEISTGINNKPVVRETNNQINSMENNTGVYDRRLIGKWNRSGSSHPHYADASSWGTAGYTTSRYEFKPDGTYIYTERSFRMTHPNIYIVKESGRFSVNNNLITITPEKSVLECYTKKNNVDELGAPVKTENRKPEQTAYTFTFHYFSGIQEWNLVFQAPNPTIRDGNFSNNDTYKNAWYFDQKYTDNELTSPGGK